MGVACCGYRRDEWKEELLHLDDERVVGEGPVKPCVDDVTSIAAMTASSNFIVGYQLFTAMNEAYWSVSVFNAFVSYWM